MAEHRTPLAGWSLRSACTLRTPFHAACNTAGRDPATLERSAAVLVEVGPHEPSAMIQAPLTGGPEEIAAGLRAYSDEGISHHQVVLEPTTPTGIAAFAPVLTRLDRG